MAITRWGLVAAALLALVGCINLPPALERELECPAAGTPSNFGDPATCAPPPR